MFAATADNWIKEKLYWYVFDGLVRVVEDREWEQQHRTQVDESEWRELITDDVAQDYMSKARKESACNCLQLSAA